MTKVVFLDRDGTINEDLGYVTQPERLKFVPGSAKAVGDLKRAGFTVVVVTNQSAVGRGLAEPEGVHKTNQELSRLLSEADSDAAIDFYAISYDHPDHASDERKPGIGLLRQVREKFEFNIEDCWMFGDKLSDVEFGLNAGIPSNQSLLVRTGYGEQTLADAEGREIPNVKDLAEGVGLVLG